MSRASSSEKGASWVWSLIRRSAHSLLGLLAFLCCFARGCCFETHKRRAGLELTVNERLINEI